jgi:transcriptional regulator with XRE-family HTH domain
MQRRPTRLGPTLKKLRKKAGLSLKQVLDGVRPLYTDERSLRRLEAGQRRPNRESLIAILAKGLRLDFDHVNEILISVGFDKLHMNESGRYNLTPVDLQQSLPSAQLVRWAPTDGLTAGVLIDSIGGPFIPWTELKYEIETRLLPKMANIPPRSTVRTQAYRGHKDFVVRIVNPSGNVIGSVWFGPNPDNNWAYDGLVRTGCSTDAGAPQTVVWQVFQRYSDGSYRTLAAYN